MLASGNCAPEQRRTVVQFVYFTFVAAILYLASSWIVDRLEIAAGKRFENRSLVFFAIIMVLALLTFSLIRSYTGNP